MQLCRESSTCHQHVSKELGSHRQGALKVTGWGGAVHVDHWVQMPIVAPINNSTRHALQSAWETGRLDIM